MSGPHPGNGRQSPGDGLFDSPSHAVYYVPYGLPPQMMAGANPCDTGRSGYGQERDEIATWGRTYLTLWGGVSIDLGQAGGLYPGG